MAVDMQTINQDKLMAFVGNVVDDFGATISSALVVIGDKLGLYKAMADGEPVTSAELAAKTGTSERYLRDWLVNQAAGGYLEYDPRTGKYRLPPEQAFALTNEDGPIFMPGGFQQMTAMIRAEPEIAERMRSGAGLPWGEHDHGVFEGTARFFRSGYIANLVDSWIPALDGVERKLQASAKVADIGCGFGASTIIMAQAYPNSRFYGFDNHEPSILRSRKDAEEAGVADRITFEVADATAYPGNDYDLIAYFDCLHDLPDPAGSTKRSYEALAPDGTVLIVEPMAGDKVEENLNPVGRIYSAASVLLCTPHALSNSQTALGTIATEQDLREVVTVGGFSSFRRATETPFNRVFEARR